MSDKVWYIAVGGEQQGPHSLGELTPRFASGELGRDTYVYTAGMTNWEPAGDRPELQSAFGGGAAPAPLVAPAPAPAAYAAGPAGQAAHEIDYEIFGEEMQFVEITLDPQEAVVAEAGAFMFMEPDVDMETIFGDGSGKGGGGLMGMLGSAVKRVVTGESLFMTVFGNKGAQRRIVAFAAPYPGRIIPVDLREHGGKIVCQKDAFLCAAQGVALGIELQRKLGAGFFGGEGFILQKLEGDGLTFLHAGGTVVKKTLAPGEQMRLDTGCLVAFEQTVGYDIQMVKGIKSAIFGGEGLFYAVMSGPGDVWIQSLPFSRLAGKVFAAAPQTGGRTTGEGSALGGLGGLIMGGND